MDFSKKRLTIAEAKEMDMVNYLSELGHEPPKSGETVIGILRPA